MRDFVCPLTRLPLRRSTDKMVRADGEMHSPRNVNAATRSWLPASLDCGFHWQRACGYPGGMACVAMFCALAGC